MSKLFDAHIHLDQYSDIKIEEIIDGFHPLTGLISVSTNLESSKRNLMLAQKYKKVHAAFGYHPEQPPPTAEVLEQLITWMTQNKESMVAIGEVGLPYYLRKESPSNFSLQPYIDTLDKFIQLAKEWEKPIVLHAVNEDAPTVCDLLEKHSVTKAHFHWFKGDNQTLKRMKHNGYSISVTPDVCYEKEIQDIVHEYPLELLMVETDGPWPFEGPFQKEMTHPRMIEESIQVISDIKKMPIELVYDQLLKNTLSFYSIQS